MGKKYQKKNYFRSTDERYYWIEKEEDEVIKDMIQQIQGVRL